MRRFGIQLFAITLLVSVSLVTLPLGAQNKLAIPEGIEYRADVEYGKGGGETLHMDIALPKNAKGPLPCVIMIHGGGWRGGDKKAHTEQILMFAQRGYVSATVQYRFCPQHTFPAQVEDVKCAVRYLRAHADELMIAPDRIGAVGFSAGAHLSMMLGTMQPEDGFEGEGGWADQNSEVQAVVSFAGPTKLGADDLPEISQGIVKAFLGATKTEEPERYTVASPITYVSPGDAPHLLFQGTKDQLVPHTQATAMADALTAAEIPGRVELLLGADHSLRAGDYQKMFAEMMQFFDRYLKQPASEGK